MPLSQSERSSLNKNFLLYAALGTPAYIKDLVENGAEIEFAGADGERALMCAAGRGMEEAHAAVVKALLERGTNVDARGSEGITALMRAAGWNNVPALKALLAAGAKVDLQDDLGRTALTWAARSGPERPMVQNLLQAGAKIGVAEALLLDDFPNARALLAQGDTSGYGPYGENLLMLAAEKGQSDIVRTLLQRGAHVNARDQQGMTALMLAIGGRAIESLPSGSRTWTVTAPAVERTKIVEMLLARHANPNLQNTRRETALSIAQQGNSAPMIRLLTQHGARTRVFERQPFYLAPHTPVSENRQGRRR